MMRDPTKCNAREESFCLAYHQLHDKVRAFCIAYDADERDADIRRRAAVEYRKQRVQNRIVELERMTEANTLEAVRIEVEKRERIETQVVERSVFDAMAVMRHWMDIATADISKIVQHRRINCRWCNGKDHAYQWRDKAEHTAAVAEAMDTNVSRTRAKLKPRDLPSDKGGYGFIFNAMPHAECPRCRGEGISDVLLMDTNLLGPKERKLLKSVKMKKGDIEFEFHDQMAAMRNIAQALGMLTEKVKLVEPGEVTDLPAIPLDPVEASRMYTQLVRGY